MATAPTELVGTEVAATEEEFERLYQEHVADVYRYALAVLRNPTDAEDVTQTTFLNAWRAFRRGEYPRAPQNWFLSIAHNVCRVRFRTLARRPREAVLDPDLVVDPTADAPSAQEILDALGELPLNQRAALVMRELEGRSYGEIAQILGVTKPAVETLLFRARKSLRLRASSLRALAGVQLPPSLASFFRNGGALEAGAAAAVGSGIVVKAVAVMAAGVAAAGAATQQLVKAEPKEPGARVELVRVDRGPGLRDTTRPAAKPARAAEIGVPSRSSARGRHDDVRGDAADHASVATRAVGVNEVDDAVAVTPQPERTQTIPERVVNTIPVELPRPPKVSAPAAPVEAPRVPTPELPVSVPDVPLPEVNAPAAAPPLPVPGSTLP